MKAIIQHEGKTFSVNLNEAIDISIPMVGRSTNVNAWYATHPVIEPVVDEDFVISVTNGSSVNFNRIEFIPHAHGTHTECVGHITEDVFSINQHLKQFFFIAEVITVAPGRLEDDYVISRKQVEMLLKGKRPEALVIRTIPNTLEKCAMQYSHTNHPYLAGEAAKYLCDIGVKHLLIDLPSIDKEKDEGRLEAHNAFWNTQGKVRMEATITEFIFVPNSVTDGSYLLNLQIAPFENDASPSKPILYKIETTDKSSD